MIGRKVSGVVLVLLLVGAALYLFYRDSGNRALVSGEIEKMVVSAQASEEEMRGVWISYDDFSHLGLSKKSESDFRANTVKFLNNVKEYGVNTVFFHARAFDDATWKSDTFHASSYLVEKKKADMTAAQAYEYDPLGVFLEETHKQGMKFHAWLNPYRISHNYFYDPGKETSQNRVIKAVEELLTYDLDGIHFDDYFYHASKGYCTVEDPKTYYSIVDKEGADYSCDDYIVVSAANKRTNVNRMVTAVHKMTAAKGKVFGISPQGNYDNDMASGADIKTWLSDGSGSYIDYIVPQIYWSNQWGSDGKTTMFSDRLDLFLSKKTNNVRFYVGLALYKTGLGGDNDTVGWTGKDTNLLEQIKELKNKKADGYVYFSAQDFSESHAAKELANVKAFVGGTSTPTQTPDKTTKKTTATGKKAIKITSVKAKKGKKKITGKVSVKKATVRVKVGSAKYKKAKVRGKSFTFSTKSKLKKGTVVRITATAKNYKKTTKKVKVK